MQASSLGTLLAATVSLAILAIAPPSTAQVAADGTLSTRITSPDNRNFTIEDGDRAGGNLFHSFREFSVPTGGSAYFNNAGDVQNIFSRVTGGTVSNIDGLIRANGGANLFLLNPSGILFGPHARLNIGGSFVSSTADNILFDNGFTFSATNPQAPPLLTITAPIGLQFGSHPGSITVQGSGHNARLTTTTPVSGLPSATSGLQVKPGRTLALLGGNLAVDGGLLFAPGGRIELGSVIGGTATLTAIPQGFSLSYPNASTFGNIQMTQRALASVGGVNAGSIQIQGQRVSIENGSIVLVQNQGSQASGDIRVTASESFQLSGASPNLRSFSSLVNDTAATGAGGNITIATPRLVIENGAVVLNRTFGNAPGGNITVNASSIRVSGKAPVTPFPAASTLFATAHGNGTGGSLSITTQDLFINNSGAVGTRNYGQGNSGAVNVRADTIRVIGPTPPPNGVLGPVTSPSLLTSSTFGTGTSGSLAIDTRTLSIQNGGLVSASSLNQGSAGNVTINASESIEVSGRVSPQDPSYISGTVRVVKAPGFSGIPGNGDAGSITINTPLLNINDGATVFVANQGNGNAGTLRINADVLQLDQGGSISASTNAGEGGGINLQTDTLTLRRESEITATAGSRGNGGKIAIASGALNLLSNSHISTEAQGSGNAGTLQLRVGDLNLNQGQIQVENQGTGDAGRLTIDANSVQLNNHSLINASTQVGQGGDIQVQVRNTLRLNDHSQILADAQQAGRGGNVGITATETVLHDRSLISTNAQGRATGGELRIEGDRLSLFEGSQITSATTGSGNSGSIAIATDRLDIFGNSQISTQAQGSGNAGTLNLRVGELTLNRGKIGVESQGTGNAGRLTIDADSAQLNNRSLINASTQVGQGGDVQLQVRNTLNLNNHSQILADAQQAGRGGNVSVTATETVLNERSRISTNAQGRATGGELRIEGDRLSLTNGSQITASTSGSGRAGSLNIHATDAISLSGNHTRLAAASTTDAAAGSIALQTSQLRVSDRASISVSGAGRGGAGDLTVQADTIRLDQQAALDAEVAGGNQGNITLNANRALLLRHRSTITTNATGTASGGNIDITSPFLIGLENSDIVAQAQAGSGGNINIGVNSVLGIAPSATLTDNSDINASSQLGLNGSVSISNPDVKPDSGLVELPEGVVDSSQQIAQTCAATQASRFVATGRGGIPENPTQGLGSDRSWNDVRDLSSFTHSNTEAVMSAPEPPALVEASQARVNAQGQVELVSIASIVPSHRAETCSAAVAQP